VLYLGFLKFLKRDKGKEPDLDLKNLGNLDVPPLPPDIEEGGLGKIGKLPELPELPDIPKEKGTGEFPELPEMPEPDESLSGIEEKPVPELKIPPGKPFPKLKFPGLKPAGKQSFPRYSEPTGPKPKGSPGPRPLPSVPEFPEPAEGSTGPEPTGSIGEPTPRRPLFGMQRPAPNMPGFQEQMPKADVPAPKPKMDHYERFQRAAVREERDVLRHKEAEGPIYIRIERFRNILAGTREIRNNLKIAGQSVGKMDEIDADRDKVLEKWHNVMTDLQKKLIFVDQTLFKK
jgi:hypothetical protein